MVNGSCSMVIILSNILLFFMVFSYASSSLCTRQWTITIRSLTSRCIMAITPFSAPVLTDAPSQVNPTHFWRTSSASKFWNWVARLRASKLPQAPALGTSMRPTKKVSVTSCWTFYTVNLWMNTILFSMTDTSCEPSYMILRNFVDLIHCSIFSLSVYAIALTKTKQDLTLRYVWPMSNPFVLSRAHIHS